MCATAFANRFEDGKAVFLTNRHVCENIKGDDLVLELRGVDGKDIFEQRWDVPTLDMKFSTKSDICSITAPWKRNPVQTLEVVTGDWTSTPTANGEEVMTFGFPFCEPVWSRGFYTGRYWPETPSSLYQHGPEDCLFVHGDPGISGSPIIDQEGHFIGILNAQVKRGNELSVSVPTKQVEDFLNEKETV